MNGITQMLQNCQFHNRRLESLGYLIVFYNYNVDPYGFFFTLKGYHTIFTSSPFLYISIHFASTLCMYYMCHSFDDRTVSMPF